VWQTHAESNERSMPLHDVRDDRDALLIRHARDTVHLGDLSDLRIVPWRAGRVAYEQDLGFWVHSDRHVECCNHSVKDWELRSGYTQEEGGDLHR